MATIRFYTRSEVKNRLAPVYIQFTDGRNIIIRLKTPYKFIPEYWDEKRQAVTKNILGTAEFTRDQAKDLEDEFSKLRDVIFRDSFKLTVPISKQWLKSVIDRFYYKQDPGIETLNEYIDRFVREATAGKRLCFSGSTKKAYSAGTLHNIRNFQHSFDLYQGIYKPQKRKKEIKKDRPYKPLNWQDITIDWYNDWLSYFYNRNCSPNYIGKHLKTFKALLRQAREEGFPVNNEVDRKAFKVISAPTENIYLTEEELQKLYDLDLSKEKQLEVIRDVFLVGCFTAQRYSDYSRINKSNIKEIRGQKVIELIQKKTAEKCIIPVSPECNAILQKYDYILPKTYEQKINDRIKIIGKRAGITEVINFEQSRGGFRVKINAIKANLIKTHTARRTGCTNMYLAGIPVINIMKISGHKTEKEFLKYIKVTKEQTAINLARHPYFKRSRLRIV